MLPKTLKGKTVLVSGAAGFVPSTLAEFYLNLGADVIGLDNFITGSRSNIKILEKYEKFRFHECNIFNKIPSFKGKKINYIFSLASPASPLDFQTVPLEIMRVNSAGTLRILELAREKKARFLLASTSEIYGDPKVHPQDESYFGHVNSIGPRSCYDESKRFAEALTMTFHRQYKVNTRIVRIFNTYGPRMRPNDGRVIPAFINQALKGEDLTVNGEGNQTRSFCYVTDLVQAIHNVMFSNDPTPFNCGNPEEYTIKEAAEIIIKTLNSKSKLIFQSFPQDDPQKRRPVMDKLYTMSDYRPQVSFEEGIKKTAEYFQLLLKKKKS